MGRWALWILKWATHRVAGHLERVRSRDPEENPYGAYRERAETLCRCLQRLEGPEGRVEDVQLALGLAQDLFWGLWASLATWSEGSGILPSGFRESRAGVCRDG